MIEQANAIVAGMKSAVLTADAKRIVDAEAWKAAVKLAMQIRAEDGPLDRATLVKHGFAYSQSAHRYIKEHGRLEMRVKLCRDPALTEITLNRRKLSSNPTRGGFVNLLTLLGAT